MANRRRGRRGFALLLAALAVLGVGSVSAQALVIVVDPGVEGSQSIRPILDIVSFSIRRPLVEVRFALMKHVEAIEWGFRLSPGRNDPQLPLLRFGFFLTNELGDMVAGTELLGFASIDDPEFLLSVPLLSPVVAHGIQISFATSFDFVIDIFVDGRVGVWGIPEPSTLTLFGAGLLGLALLVRRRRKAA